MRAPGGTVPPCHCAHGAGVGLSPWVGSSKSLKGCVWDRRRTRSAQHECVAGSGGERFGNALFLASIFPSFNLFCSHSHVENSFHKLELVEQLCSHRGCGQRGPCHRIPAATHAANTGTAMFPCHHHPFRHSHSPALSSHISAFWRMMKEQYVLCALGERSCPQRAVLGAAQLR